MNYIAVRGKDDPNEEDGAYKAAIGVLYAIAYTIKMSKMGDHRMEGCYDFVVPPLEDIYVAHIKQTQESALLGLLLTDIRFASNHATARRRFRKSALDRWERMA